MKNCGKVSGKSGYTVKYGSRVEICSIEPKTGACADVINFKLY